MTVHFPKASRRLGYILIAIIFGAVLRLFLSSHAYPNLVFDARTYVDYALDFLRGGFPIDRNKNLGYSVFLAILFWVRGGADVEFVRMVQVIMDIAAGICIWIAARNMFKQSVADIALVLYMINPFTASYVGIILPETLSCFLVALLALIVSDSHFRKSSILWLFSGLLVGLLLFAKPALLYFALGTIGAFILLFTSKRTIVKFSLTIIIGFFIASSYTLGINYRIFGKIALASPYSTMGGQTYLMMFYADRYPEVEFWGVSPMLVQIFKEYEGLHDSQIRGWNSHYFNLLFTKFKSEPMTVFSHYFKNIFWLWDKDHLSVYEDPWYPADRYILRVTNLVLLGFGIIGIARYLKEGLKALREPLMIVTVLMVATMTLLFPLVSNESRHTIPFYPLLFLWVAYGLGKIIRL